MSWTELSVYSLPLDYNLVSVQMYSSQLVLGCVELLHLQLYYLLGLHHVHKAVCNMFVALQAETANTPPPPPPPEVITLSPKMSGSLMLLFL
jgi:hypothetical protein